MLEPFGISAVIVLPSIRTSLTLPEIVTDELNATLLYTTYQPSVDPVSDNVVMLDSTMVQVFVIGAKPSPTNVTETSPVVNCCHLE